MTNQRLPLFSAHVIGVALIVMAMTAGLLSESQAQIKPSMKIKLNVLPSTNISRMDADMQKLFTEDIAHLNELIAERNDGADPVSLGCEFSISAYENITVLLSYTTLVQAVQSNNDSHPMRIVCGYLNDGTTYFKRATITNKNAIQFRLRNNSLLRRSMKLDNSLFVAYVLFLTNQRNEQIVNESSIPVSTVTFEFM